MTKEENKEILKLYRRVLKVPYKRHGFTWYEAQFRSQAELYQYLSSNPKINRKIFSV